MLEIYNEECKDLLGKGTANLTGPGGSKRPPIAHDDKGHTTVAGVDAIDVRSEERLKSLMARAACAPLLCACCKLQACARQSGAPSPTTTRATPRWRG